MTQKKIYTYIVGPVRTNCYLVADSNGNCAIIDPGDNAESLITKIKEKGLTLSKILLTHPHFDHIGALNEIALRYNTAVHIHELDAPTLRNPAASLFRAPALDSAVNLETFTDDETIQAGEMRFIAIHTPGHTRGSSCFLLEDNLFTGDTLFRRDVGRTDLEGGSDEELDASLIKLATLPGDYKVWPGHGDSTTLEKERQLNPYIPKRG